MLKKGIISVYLFVCLSLLTGCLYPENRRVENNVPIETQIASVQEAVNRFHAETGVYPILNSDMDTPIYEKYVIDMGRLYPGYLGYIPASAFENGGPFRYVLVHMEQEPAVKLIDLRISSQVATIQSLVNEYYFKKGKYPFGDPFDTYSYHIAYKELKTSPPRIESPFSGQLLNLLITPKGEVFVDYGIDIGIYINKGLAYEGKDAREVLVQNSYFVPVKSYPYVWQNGEAKLLFQLRK